MRIQLAVKNIGWIISSCSRNFQTMDIYYGELKYESPSQSPAYVWMNYFSKCQVLCFDFKTYEIHVAYTSSPQLQSQDLDYFA